MNTILSYNLENIIISYCSEYQVLILNKQLDTTYETIRKYKKMLDQLNSNIDKIKKQIMKTCLHESIIQEIYSTYDGTQFTYVCKCCNMTGDYSCTWHNNVVEYRRSF